jgi:transposase
MRTNSLDLRQRIVAAVQAGYPKTEMAAVFGVDRRTINRYLRRAEAAAPHPTTARPRRCSAV